MHMKARQEDENLIMSADLAKASVLTLMQMKARQEEKNMCHMVSAIGYGKPK